MSKHTIPSEPGCCAICTDTISKDQYLEYSSDGLSWHPGLVCASCLDDYSSSFVEGWTHEIETTDCAATIRRMLESGPPQFMMDPNLFPGCESAVKLLWRESTGEVPALYKNAKQGKEREVFWDSLKKQFAWVYDVNFLEQSGEEAAPSTSS